MHTHTHTHTHTTAGARVCLFFKFVLCYYSVFKILQGIVSLIGMVKKLVLVA